MKNQSVNFSVILINKLIMYGEIGRPEAHIFNDESEFDKWYNEEQEERWRVHSSNVPAEDLFKFCLGFLHPSDCITVV